MRKLLLTAFLTVIMIGGLALTGSVHFGTVRASTDVFGIINSETKWTKASSPYNLKGPIAVNSGVTLTIEAGATVNLNGYYIQVNGTLVARGSSTDKISLNDGSIVFTSVSNSWNEQTASGSIIENAVLTSSIRIMGVSPKITRSFLDEIYISEGSSTISYNTIAGQITVAGGSPSISNNDITNATPGSLTVGANGSPAISRNTINCRIIVKSGSPVISNNILADGIHADMYRESSIIVVHNEIFVRGRYMIIHVGGLEVRAEISDNKIVGNGQGPGIDVRGSSSASISDNSISGCSSGIVVDTTGLATIVRNLIFNNKVGISFEKNVTIRDNTIVGNSVGIQGNPSPSSTITKNNIQDNSQYNFRSESTNDIIATYNWWGTTDTQAINQSIYDFKYDFNLGTVSFVPFLTAPNSQAPAMTMTIPTPTPTPSPSPSPSPSPPIPPDQNNTQTTPQTELYGIIAVLAVIIVALLIVIIGLVLRKSDKRNTLSPSPTPLPESTPSVRASFFVSYH